MYAAAATLHIMRMFAEEGLKEEFTIWPTGTSEALLVSIGTGDGGDKDHMNCGVSSCMTTHEQLSLATQSSPTLHYFRFDVENRSSGIEFKEWLESKEIEDSTETNLSTAQISKQLENCAQILCSLQCM